eukprot:933613-Rhodomonas_salina.1
MRILEIPQSVFDDIIRAHLTDGDVLRFALTCRAAYASVAAQPVVVRRDVAFTQTAQDFVPLMFEQQFPWHVSSLLQRGRSRLCKQIDTNLGFFLGIQQKEAWMRVKDIHPTTSLVVKDVVRVIHNVEKTHIGCVEFRAPGLRVDGGTLQTLAPPMVMCGLSSFSLDVGEVSAETVDVLTDMFSEGGFTGSKLELSL